MSAQNLPRDFDRSVKVGNGSGDPLVSDGRSNGYELKVKPGSTVYRYDVEITKVGDRRRKVLTKQSDASVRTVQKEACMDIIASLSDVTGGFGVGAKFTYDGKRILYTTKPIALQQPTITLEPQQLKERAAQFLRGDRVEIEVVQNQKVPSLDYSNLGACLVGNVAEQMDLSVRTFLEVVTSQPLVNGNRYQIVSAGTLFENNAAPLRDQRGIINGMDLRVGLKKSVRITAHGEPKAFAFVDMKRSAFFSTRLLSEQYNEMIKGPRDHANFERFWRGVRMQITYNPSRTFIFGRLSRSPISSNEYRTNNLTVPQYMQQTKGIILRMTNIPAIHPDQPGGNKVLYPIECVRPLGGQVVPIEKQTTFSIQALLTENSMPAHDRFTYCEQQLSEITGGAGAAFLAHFGLSFVQDSNKVQIYANPMPKIVVGEDRIIQPKGNGSWNDDLKDVKLLLPSTKLKRWIVAYDSSALNEGAAKRYIQMLIHQAYMCGMTLPPPLAYIQTDMNRMENEVFKLAVKDTIQFVFYIDSANQKSHGRLKLLEAFYKVLTQHVVEKNLNNGSQTLTNVLLKMNCKAFGLNYHPIASSPLLTNLKLESPDLLVIGYDIAPPPPFTGKDLSDYMRKHRLKPDGPKIKNIHPAGVGICANKSEHPYMFSGDIFYQEANGGLIDPKLLSVAVSKITAAASQHRPNITRLIVFRDGCSEGEYSGVVSQELPAIRNGFCDGLKRTQENANVGVKITLIVSTKMHNKRFFREENKKIFNTRAGDSIRGNGLRSDINEVYVQSHHPLKGVPKIPASSVLINENEISKEAFEPFFVYMSNMHQICACPTSLPLPVYMADELAKRAEEIYKAFCQYRMTNEGRNFAPSIVNHLDVYDPRSLTEKLEYCTHLLYGTRFNA